jgi:hypothetical protein
VRGVHCTLRPRPSPPRLNLGGALPWLVRREADEAVLQSDADEQLLIHIPFREVRPHGCPVCPPARVLLIWRRRAQTVKVKSITIKAPSDGTLALAKLVWLARLSRLSWRVARPCNS